MALRQIAVAVALLAVTVAGAALEQDSSVTAESKDYGQVIDFKKLYPDVFHNGSAYEIKVTDEEYLEGGGFYERILSRTGKTIFSELPEIRKSLNAFGEALDKTSTDISTIKNDVGSLMDEFIDRNNEVKKRFVALAAEHEMIIFSRYWDVSSYETECVKNVMKKFDEKMVKIKETIKDCVDDAIEDTNAFIQNEMNKVAYATLGFTKDFENVIKCLKRTYSSADQAIGCVEIAMEEGLKNNKNFTKLLIIFESRLADLKKYMPGEICFDKGMRQIEENYYAEVAEEASKCDQLKAEEKN